jgi:hypothetical protein
MFLGVDIAGVPVCTYALVSFAPLGLIAGALAGRLCLVLIDRGYARTGVSASLALGLVIGAMSAPVLVAALLIVTGNRPQAATLVTGMISGGACGLLIAGYARRRMRVGR